MQSTGQGYVIVELAGLGLRVEVPSATASSVQPGVSVTLMTELIVREDSLTLYGFETANELDVFNRLMTVSGVGPRSALGVLSHLTAFEIVAAVSNEDPKPFQRVSGIGPKTAKLITVSLSGKLKHLQHVLQETEPEAAPTGAAQVVEGLVNLGWQEGQATQAVEDAVAAGASNESSELMRAALALLQAGRGRGGKR